MIKFERKCFLTTSFVCGFLSICGFGFGEVGFGIFTGAIAVGTLTWGLL